MTKKEKVVQDTYRYISKKFKGCLTDHEREELRMDFGIDVEGSYVLASLTKKEWADICDLRKGD